MWLLIAVVASGCLLWLTLEGMKVDPAQRRLREDGFHHAFITRPSATVHELVGPALSYVCSRTTVRNEKRLRQLLTEEIELRLESYLLVLHRHMVQAFEQHGNDWRRFSIVSIDGHQLAQITKLTDEQFSRGEEMVEALRTLTRHLTRKKIGEVKQALTLLESSARS